LEFRFIFAWGGSSAIGPGWIKGIQFSPQGAKLIGQQVATLDNERNLPEGVNLKELMPNWFILYRRDDRAGGPGDYFMEFAMFVQASISASGTYTHFAS
jgi:hypothetical protein